MEQVPFGDCEGLAAGVGAELRLDPASGSAWRRWALVAQLGGKWSAASRRLRVAQWPAGVVRCHERLHGGRQPGWLPHQHSLGRWRQEGPAIQQADCHQAGGAGSSHPALSRRLSSLLPYSPPHEHMLGSTHVPALGWVVEPNVSRRVEPRWVEPSPPRLVSSAAAAIGPACAPLPSAPALADARAWNGRELRGSGPRPTSAATMSQRDSHGIRTGFVRDSHGVRTGFVRDSHGIRTGFVRDSYGIRAGFARDSHGIRAGLGAP